MCLTLSTLMYFKNTETRDWEKDKVFGEPALPILLLTFLGHSSDFV